MFNLLLQVWTEHDLLYKPDRIIDQIDETGVPLNNPPGNVITIKEAKVVYSITPKEKRKTMSIVVYSNAVGNLLPPVVIVKGVNKKRNLTLVSLRDQRFTCARDLLMLISNCFRSG